MEHPSFALAGTAAIGRTLDLFEALVHNGGARPLSAIAMDIGLPSSTAYRMAALLVRRGLIAPARRGHYRAGLTLIDLAAGNDPNATLADAARPLLRRLARKTRATAHLGVWGDDMVTYLVKESGHGAKLFTREGGQLEAYCSAIGKVLLAHMDAVKQEAYLAAGPFVALTAQTVVEPERIRAVLQRAKLDGYATDDEEIADGLFCIALPLQRDDGRVLAAISLSMAGSRDHLKRPPPELVSCAKAIQARLGETRAA